MIAAPSDPASADEGEHSNSASLRVAVGPFAAPLVWRVVSIVAARAECPVDRLDDALLICDALAAHAPAHLADGHLGLTVNARRGGLQLRLGPLQAGEANALIADASVPGVGNVLERVADALRVEPAEDGHETLLIELAY